MPPLSPDERRKRKREANALKESLRAVVPDEIKAQGLESMYRSLVKRAILGDERAASQVLELSGFRAAGRARLRAHFGRLDRVNEPDFAGVAAQAVPVDLLDELSQLVGNDIVTEARRLVAELDLGIAEVLRRGHLGLPMSDLERTIFENAKDVCELRRIEVEHTPQGQRLRLIPIKRGEGEGQVE